MKDSDKLINKYLDNEISQGELEELNSLFYTEPEVKEKFDASRILETSIKNMPVPSTGKDFTANVMQKLYTVGNKAKKNIYYFYGVIAFFVIAIFGYLGYITYNIMPKNLSLSSDSKLKKAVESADNLIVDTLSKNIFNKDTLLIINCVMLFAVMTVMYFLYESFRKKNNNRMVRQG